MNICVKYEGGGGFATFRTVHCQFCAGHFSAVSKSGLRVINWYLWCGSGCAGALANGISIIAAGYSGTPWRTLSGYLSVAVLYRSVVFCAENFVAQHFLKELVYFDYVRG